MKPQESRRPEDAGHPGRSLSEGPVLTNGSGRAAPASFDGEATRRPDHGFIQRSRPLRWLYWTVWFGIVPIALSSFVLWALSPAGGSEMAGPLGWAQSMVRSQSVPVGIVLFTMFEVALWAFRLRLPLARFAHPPHRPDLPPHLGASFERARALLDEAEMILSKRERELAAKERERLRFQLDALRDTMERVPFDEAAYEDALTHAADEVDHRLGRWRKSEVREYAEAILMAVAVAFALRALVIEAFKIPSGSMIPTLMVGDHIFVNKFIYGPAIPFTHTRLWTNMPPKRGDVMVFAYPEHPEQDFIKRVIAVEGDKLEVKNGHPIINGWEVPSCRLGLWSYSEYDSPGRHEGDLYVEFLGGESYLTFYDHASGGIFAEYQGPYYAKKGEVWVMGDNRNNSHDSRMWYGGQGGGVPFDNIKGRALFVWLSIAESGPDLSREGLAVMGAPRLPPTARNLEPQLAQCMKNRPAITHP